MIKENHWFSTIKKNQIGANKKKNSIKKLLKNTENCYHKKVFQKLIITKEQRSFWVVVSVRVNFNSKLGKFNTHTKTNSLHSPSG